MASLAPELDIEVSRGAYTAWLRLMFFIVTFRAIISHALTLFADVATLLAVLLIVLHRNEVTVCGTSFQALKVFIKVILGVLVSAFGASI